MSASLSGMPGGVPSTTQPSAGPWLSPKVVTRKRWPKVLWDMRLARWRLVVARAMRGGQIAWSLPACGGGLGGGSHEFGASGPPLYLSPASGGEDAGAETLAQAEGGNPRSN